VEGFGLGVGPDSDFRLRIVKLLLSVVDCVFPLSTDWTDLDAFPIPRGLGVIEGPLRHHHGWGGPFGLGLDGSAEIRHHEAIMSVEAWPDDVAVTAFRRRMVCTGCGMIGADVRPNWKEQSPRPSLTGAHWQR
jgi:hypothetical protein